MKKLPRPEIDFGTRIEFSLQMLFKRHIALLLTMAYLIGLCAQFVPVLAKSALIDGQVERECPRKDANQATDYAFNQASTDSGQGMHRTIFIPCLSSQQNTLAYDGLNLRFNSLRLLTPMIANYESPELTLDPFPPKLA